MIASEVERAVAIYTSPQFPFKGFLFNEDYQILNQSSDEKIWFYLVENNRAIGRFILHLDDKQGLSPFRAPFGSFEATERLDFSSLDVWVKELIKYSEERGLNSLRIVSYPFCYSPDFSVLLTTALTSNKFNIKITDLNFHLDTASDFENGIHESEKRRLRKSEKEGFSFKILSSVELPVAHELIRECRERKGYPLSMQRDEFLKLISKNEFNYKPFGLFHQGRLIATSVGVRINEEILYDFLPADAEEYKSFSPMVLLKKGIFHFCQENGYKIFDLGIATSNGIPNHGLIRFKENMGGIPSLKLTFEFNF